MPNRQRCGPARNVLDTSRCGIVLIMPVLRVGRNDRIPTDLHRFQKRGYTYCGNPAVQLALTRVGKNGANGVRHREEVCLSFMQVWPTGGLRRIIRNTNLDQRPTPQPSGPQWLSLGFGIVRHSA